MRILWLKSDLLLPLDKGGKLRTWHVMRHLARKHEITYLSFEDASQTEADRAGMREVCARLETVPRADTAKGTWRFYADAARYLVNPAPYAVAKYRSDAYRARLASLLAGERFDALVCDFLPPVVNMPAFTDATAGRPATILFTHNVEAEIWRRHAENAANPISKRLLAQQWRRMLRFERDALARFDLVLAVSEADRHTFARLYPNALRRPVHVVQTGVETDYFTPSPVAPVRTHMVFTGSMDWLPNEDAMLFFCRDILPLIRAEEPDVALSIVGRAPTPAVRRLAADHGVEVTGRVDDVRPYMREAAVYVVPLRIGGGTRLKIFEAMAMAKAVVSTAVGAEGLPVTGGEHLLLADEPRGFARAVVRLLRDLDRRRAIEQAARQLVVSQYDWSVVAGDLESALTRFAAAAREPARASQAAPPRRVAV
jgi:sugar transferase (PEP-CTERM/EpsH1 system associated)